MRLQKWHKIPTKNKQFQEWKISDMSVPDDLNAVVHLIARNCRMDPTDIAERLEEVVNSDGVVIGQEFTLGRVRYLVKREQ